MSARSSVVAEKTPRRMRGNRTAKAPVMSSATSSCLIGLPLRSDSVCAISAKVHAGPRNSHTRLVGGSRAEMAAASPRSTDPNSHPLERRGRARKAARRHRRCGPSREHLPRELVRADYRRLHRQGCPLHRSREKQSLNTPKKGMCENKEGELVHDRSRSQAHRIAILGRSRLRPR
jgi:hypothetical protein